MVKTFVDIEILGLRFEQMRSSSMFPELTHLRLLGKSRKMRRSLEHRILEDSTQVSCMVIIGLI